MTELIDARLTLRPITSADESFLYQVYASTREDELSVLDWDAAQKQAFLRMQFEAQHTFYMEQFAGAAFKVMLVDGQAAGRLYVQRKVDEIRIIDIALLPDFRNQGIGSACLEAILAEGKEAGLPVRIHVEFNNPALRLYQRFGFQKVAENGVYYLMEALPDRLEEADHA